MLFHVRVSSLEYKIFPYSFYNGTIWLITLIDGKENWLNWKDLLHFLILKVFLIHVLWSRIPCSQCQNQLMFQPNACIFDLLKLTQNLLYLVLSDILIPSAEQLDLTVVFFFFFTSTGVSSSFYFGLLKPQLQKGGGRWEGHKFEIEVCLHFL